MFLHLSVILFTGRGLCRGGLCRGDLCRGGLCLGGSLSRGVPVRKTHLYGKERAVRILLECFLVYIHFHLKIKIYTIYTLFRVFFVNAQCYIADFVLSKN